MIKNNRQTNWFKKNIVAVLVLVQYINHVFCSIIPWSDCAWGWVHCVSRGSNQVWSQQFVWRFHSPIKISAEILSATHCKLCTADPKYSTVPLVWVAVSHPAYNVTLWPSCLGYHPPDSHLRSQECFLSVKKWRWKEGERETECSWPCQPSLPRC